MCRLQCAGVRLRSRGECPPVTRCPCSKILAPVFGKDERTYNNQCILKCKEFVGNDDISVGKHTRNYMDNKPLAKRPGQYFELLVHHGYEWYS
ncbi:hypothetical protein DPMN_180904 [Dreissena polymorpha]|uniref:Kazal-like domain-containing protein n=1 Tax=Dreissena polymorpha TaxID=45954 RepID=A0A9D4DCU5_DREPO|nr:hypothetical protein DPMN_180904 [Dreissena polymorpha]